MSKDQKKYISRQVEKLLQDALKQFPACLITGPRQAGKSTLLQHFLKEYQYANLDDLDVRALAKEDPKYFFEKYPPPVVIDEIQYAPELLSYIKILIDKDRDLCGRFVLTGSQIFQVMKGVSESLAGRIAIFDLYPLMWNELYQGQCLTENPKSLDQLFDLFIKGFYPELYTKEKLNLDLWFRTYIRTYIERDVRDIKAIVDLSRFQTFMQVLAARVGRLINYSEISKEIGISVSTVKDWFSILESTYIIRLLRPFHNNMNKRLVKSPKLYFVDTGLLCHLLGLTSKEQIEKSPFRGFIFENMLILETIKKLETEISPLKCYFYKTINDLEVDLVLATTHIQKAFEIKFSMTPNQRMAQGLSRFKKDFPQAETSLISLSTSHVGFPGMKEIHSLHWTEYISSLKD